MAITAKKNKSNLVRNAISLADGKESGKNQAILKRFIGQFYDDSAPDDIAGANPEQLFAAAASAFTFAKTRPAGKPLIRVLTPSAKKSRKPSWPVDRTVIEIVTDDMPFLVDSITAELDRLGEQPLSIIHPVIPVKRDAQGKLVDVYPDDEVFRDEAVRAKKGVHFESVMHIQIDKETDPEIVDRMSDTVRSVLGDVRRAVEDWS
ncbi:MAG: NAD-glutamate dehydrogenase, partial [Rhodospirillaceae bacterium]|nr:NAD-glutamate dehydrogenase [Rhodospirillaceae bacterium]